MSETLFCSHHNLLASKLPPGLPCPSCRVEHLVIEVNEARATITRLNRRAQAAESAARVTVEECARKGVSFGRGLANWYAGKLREERDALKDALEEITSTAREVKPENTPEFMEWLHQRIEFSLARLVSQPGLFDALDKQASVEGGAK